MNLDSKICEKNNNYVLTFGAGNVGNLPNLEYDRNLERDEGLMFPGFFDKTNSIKIDNSCCSKPRFQKL